MAPAQEPTEKTVQVFWSRLLTSGENSPLLQYTYMEWKPWIQTLFTFSPPQDPLHCTHNYVSTPHHVYLERWEEEREGITEHLKIQHIYLGKEGVAAHCLLTAEQKDWYAFATYAEPHITLAIGAGHESKSLGSMVKKAVQLEWTYTDSPLLSRNDEVDMWRIFYTGTEVGMLETQNLTEYDGSDTTAHPDTPRLLADLPDSLWTTGPYDVGLIPNHTVTVRTLQHQVPVWRPQYRLKPEQEAGIADTIEGLLEAGVLIPCCSQWNTPILPVAKADKGWRKLSIMLPRQRYCPFQRPEHQYFTVIDLANAFFCLPLSIASRQLFAFTYRGQQFTYTRLPQGFRDSPGLFNAALCADLHDLELPADVILIQYVDDLLLAAPTAGTCLEATYSLLSKVAAAGYKVKKEKVQVCRSAVTFLGHLISESTL